VPDEPLFDFDNFEFGAQDLLNWLKVSLIMNAFDQVLKKLLRDKAIRPIPYDVIERWEDHRYISLWESFNYAVGSRHIKRHGEQGSLELIFSQTPQMFCGLPTTISDLLPVSLKKCRQFLAESPNVVCIIQARWLLHGGLFGKQELGDLRAVQLLLGLSSDVMNTAVSALLTMIHRRTQRGAIRVAAGIITVLALSLQLYPARIVSLTSDLACAFLRLIQRVDTEELLRSW
jgi:hypothetical protein